MVVHYTWKQNSYSNIDDGHGKELFAEREFQSVLCFTACQTMSCFLLNCVDVDINKICVTLIDVSPESLIFSKGLHANHTPTVTIDTEDN